MSDIDEAAMRHQVQIMHRLSKAAQSFKTADST